MRSWYHNDRDPVERVAPVVVYTITAENEEEAGAEDTEEPKEEVAVSELEPLVAANVESEDVPSKDRIAIVETPVEEAAVEARVEDEVSFNEKGRGFNCGVRGSCRRCVGRNSGRLIYCY